MDSMAAGESEAMDACVSKNLCTLPLNMQAANISGTCPKVCSAEVALKSV